MRVGAVRDVLRWDVPDTGHTDALRTRPQEWEERVIAFIDDALAVSDR